MRPPDNGASRHSQTPDLLPRVCALLGPRERTQVEAATDGRLTILHRATVSGIYDDIATGHADGAFLSVAIVRETDIPRLARTRARPARNAGRSASSEKTAEPPRFPASSCSAARA